MTVLVAGGGIAGLAVALSLHQIGVKVRVFESVSKEAWKLWVGHSTMLVNEYRLELGTPEANRIWLAELEKFFFGEGSTKPEGYVPPPADGTPSGG